MLHLRGCMISIMFSIPNAIRYLWSPRTDAIHELQQGSVFMLLCSSWYWNFEQRFCQTKLIGIMWIILGTNMFHDYHLGVNVVYNCCRTSTSTSSNATSSSGDLCIEQQYQSQEWVFFKIASGIISPACSNREDWDISSLLEHQDGAGTDGPPVP